MAKAPFNLQLSRYGEGGLELVEPCAICGSADFVRHCWTMDRIGEGQLSIGSGCRRLSPPEDISSIISVVLSSSFPMHRQCERLCDTNRCWLGPQISCLHLRPYACQEN